MPARLPPFLVLHLKRFCQTRSGLQKISTRVPFPLQLDLAPFVFPSPQLDPTRYRLNGISVHSGGLGGGHYVAYTCRSDGGWYFFSDSSVSRVNQQEVLSEEAYLLFYVREPDQ